jgi:hypothetical protein
VSTLASSALVAFSLPGSAPAVCHFEIGLAKEQGRGRQLDSDLMGTAGR